MLDKEKKTQYRQWRGGHNNGKNIDRLKNGTSKVLALVVLYYVLAGAVILLGRA